MGAVGLDGIIKAALWEVLLLISREAKEPCDREKFPLPQSLSDPVGNLVLGASTGTT